MAETAALLAEEVFPDVPLRQWVISFPFPLRYLFAAHPQAMGKVLGVFYRAISTYLIYKAGYRLRDSTTGAAHASAISAQPAAMPDKAGQALQRSIPAEQRDFGKKFFPLYAVCFSYTSTLIQRELLQPGLPGMR